MSLEDCRAFAFTEARIEQAIRLVRDGAAATKANGRRVWRDQGCPNGLHLVVGRRGATFYRVAKVAGRKVETRIGDATAMRVSKAREKARQLAAGVQAAAAAPIRVRTDGITVAEAWAAYTSDVRTGAFVAGRRPTAASTLQSYQWLYDAHLRDQYGSRSLHALAKDIQALHGRMRGKPVAANRLLQVVSNLFVHAARSGKWDKPNPTLDPITGRTIRKHHVAARERWLTTDEAARVLAFSASEPDPWSDFWPLLILTGVRVSNLREMEWAHVDLRDDGATWSIPKTKNQEPHVVPLVADAVKILRPRLEAAPKTGKGRKVRPASPWVFPMREDPTRCICDVDHAWNRVRENAPIAGVRIHDLRRTAGSWATQAGAPITAVGKFIGDKSINATAVYARADVTAARAAGELVAERFREAMRRGASK
jgi:integrase